MFSKVAPIVCTGGQLEAECAHCLHDTYRESPWLLDADYIDVVGGPRLHVMRTEGARRFLETSNEWAWYFDSDMAWEPNALWELYKVANPETHPIVGGLCFGTSRTAGALFPTIYDRDEHGHFAARFDLPRGEVTRCAGTGFAFVLVHRSVFERMAAPEAFGLLPDGNVNLLPWFADGQVGDILMEGDLSFCARAAALDIPVHVHTGVEVLHKKPFMHGRHLYDSISELQARGAV